MNNIARMAIALVLFITLIAPSAFAIGNENTSSGLIKESAAGSSTPTFGSYPLVGKGGGGNPSSKYIQIVFVNATEYPANIRIFNNVKDFTFDTHNIWLDENGKEVDRKDYVLIPAGRSYSLRLEPYSSVFRKSEYAFNYTTTIRNREGLQMTHESRFVTPGVPNKGNYYADGSIFYSLAKSPCYFGGTDRTQFSDLLAQKVMGWMGINHNHPIFEKTIKKLSAAFSKAFGCNYTETINYYSVVFTENK